MGPQSAGAVPNPACYDAGNDEPPVTDANVVLGYLDPESLAGGSVPIRSERARDAIAGRLTGPLGRDVVEVAFGHPHSGQREHDEGGQGGQGGQGGRRGNPKPVSGIRHDPTAVYPQPKADRCQRLGKNQVPLRDRVFRQLISFLFAGKEEVGRLDLTFTMRPHCYYVAEAIAREQATLNEADGIHVSAPKARQPALDATMAPTLRRAAG